MHFIQPTAPCFFRVPGRVRIPLAWSLLAAIGFAAEDPVVPLTANVARSAVVARSLATDLQFSATPNVVFNGLSTATFACGTLSSSAAGGEVTVEIWATAAPWSDASNEGFVVASKALGPLASGAGQSVTLTAVPAPVPEGVWYLTAVARRDGAVRASAEFARNAARLTDRWDLVEMRAGTFGSFYTAGGFGVSIYNFGEPVLTPGVTAQPMQIAYNMYSIPDRIDVLYGGTVVYSTGGYVSNGNSVVLPDWHAGDGPVLVRMDGSTSGTSWEFQLTALTWAPAAIISPQYVHPRAGQPFSYHIIGNRTLTGATATGFPAWLHFDAASATLSGTAPALGSGSFTVGGVVGGSNASVIVRWAVVAQAVPIIAAGQSVTAWLGVPLAYQIAASNTPTQWNVRRSIDGSPTASTAPAAGSLPAGCTLAGATGLIGGTPTTDGMFAVAVAAANSAGIGEAVVAFTVYPAPQISAPGLATIRVGHALTTAFTRAGGPSQTTTITGSIPGVSVADNGMVAGTPNVAGSATVIYSATNPAGSSVATWTLAVTPVPVPSINPDAGWNAGPGGWWTNQPATILVGSASAEPGAVIIWTLDGTAMTDGNIGADGGFTFDLGALSEGDHTIVTTYRDSYPVLGTPVTTTLHVDRTAPAPPVLTLANLGLVATRAPTLSGTAEPGATIHVRLSTTVVASALVAADGTWSVALMDVPEGLTTLAVTASDAAGNVSNATPATVTVDVTPPVVTLAWSDAARTVHPRALNLIVSEPVTDLASVAATADNAQLGALTTGNSTTAQVVVTPLAPGVVRVRVAAVHDLAGNASIPVEAVLLATGELTAFTLDQLQVPVSAAGNGPLILTTSAGTIAHPPTGGWVVTLPLTTTEPRIGQARVTATDDGGRSGNVTIRVDATTPVNQ